MFGLNPQLSAGTDIYGTASQSDLDGLRKALEAGYQTGPGSTGGSALRPESLEASLKTLSYTNQQIKLWKKIPKSPAFSTVEEYNVVTDYGGDQGAFVLEGELPQATDASYVRRFQLMKYMGTVREVTHQATLVHPANGDLTTRANTDGILWLLRQIELQLFEGDSTLAFSGEGPQWNGLDALIDQSNIIDLENQPLTEGAIEVATNQLIEAFANPTDIFMNTKAASDLSRSIYSRGRFEMPAPLNGRVGFAASTVATNAGEIEINPNVFVRKAPKPRGTATSPNAPATPGSVSVGAPTGSTGDHNKGAPQGVTSYFAYVVTAANRFGESAPTAFAGAATALSVSQKNAGNFLPITIANPAVIGAYAPEYFRIYRSKASAVNAVPASLDEYSLIAQVPAASQAALGTTVFNDVNLFLPFTSKAYIGELTPQVLTFRQLMPLMKLDLAVMGPAYRWMILMYGAPILFAPRKWAILSNIGDLSSP